jgi:hypothetical protein
MGMVYGTVGGLEIPVMGFVVVMPTLDPEILLTKLIKREGECL